MIRLAQTPTPIEPLKHPHHGNAAGKIYIKHDDLTGFEISGNKVRKLEFSIADALEKGATELLTCGGPQSNHCRATAVVGARIGMPVHLFLRETDAAPEANLFLDLLFGATIHWVPKDATGEDMLRAMEAYRAKRLPEGHNAYIIPMGASNGVGALGYRKAFEEILDYEKENGITFDAIVSAVGSGGTFAGLLLGQMRNDHSAKHYGFAVSGTEAYFNQRIAEIIDEARPLLPAAEQTNAMPPFKVNTGYVGPGYGIADPEIYALIQEIAKTEGFLLDPVYTGKAFYGMLREMEQGALSDCTNVLFIHTGGAFGNFAYKNAFSL